MRSRSLHTNASCRFFHLLHSGGKVRIHVRQVHGNGAVAAGGFVLARLRPRAPIVITYDLDGRRLNTHADPLHPDVWRMEPYFSQLKSWAAMVLPRNGQLVGVVEHRAFVILPDRAVDLGVMDDESFIYNEQLTPNTWNAHRLTGEEARAVSDASARRS